MRENTVCWSEFWDQKARVPGDFDATGRGLMDIPGFLYTLREIATLLQLEKGDVLYDIGCGTGIMALALSPWVEAVYGTDISPRMVARAQKNGCHADNVRFALGDIRECPPFAKRPNKVLAYSVLQYLSDEGDVYEAFKALRQVLPIKGRALYGANPDVRRKERYVEAVMASKRSPQAQDRELALIESTLWTRPDGMVRLAEGAGLRAEAVPLCGRIWQHFYMYNLVVYDG